MQCKDIPTRPIIEFIDSLGRWATMFEGYDNSVMNVMPPDIPEKLAKAKMARLIKHGLVNGCTCGCRGDFELTAKGKLYLEKQD